MRFVLVHSPVVGPSTWRWVAGALRSRGHEPVVPDLTAAARTGDPHAVARTAAHALDPSDDVVIVGHSGAGSVLPLIATARASVHRVVFVDAGIPPCEGTFTAGGDFLDDLRGRASHGVLPPWSQWWGEDVLHRLVADEDRRRAIEVELPAVPVAFFETPLTAPPGWCAVNGSFVLFSEPYRSDARRAASLGWQVVDRPGAHLDIANDEESLAELFVALADQS